MRLRLLLTMTIIIILIDNCKKKIIKLTKFVEFYTVTRNEYKLVKNLNLK